MRTLLVASFWVTFTLLATSKRALAQTPPPPAPGKGVTVPGACLAFAEGGGVAGKAVRSLTIAVGEQVQSLSEIRFAGLTTLNEERVWELVGGKPAGAPTVEQAAALIARLAESGIFAGVEPSLRVAGGQGGAVLEIRLTEHATLREVAFTGLGELTREELVEALLLEPDDKDVERGLTPSGKRASDEDRGGIQLACPPPAPPRTWVARFDDDKLVPGIVWRGLPAAVARIQERVRREGYRLGRVSATLDPTGKLTLAVDEGRLESVTIEGVHPAVSGRVRELLAIQPGAVFNVDDLESGLDRIEDEFPFLEPHEQRRPAPPSFELVEERRPDGSIRLTPREVPARCEEEELAKALEKGIEEAVEERSESAIQRVIRRVEVRLDRDEKDGDHDDDDDDDEDCGTERTAYYLEGGRLIVTLESDVFDLDADGLELLRHTQVTGYAPGLLLTLHVWDPGDRAHFRFDTLFHVNTGRDSRDPRGQRAIEELAAAESMDFLVSPALAVPRIGLVALGAEAHALTDTDDAWRITRLDSYLNSILFDRPDREYFRRTGLGAFAIFHLLESITVAGEYRFDQHDTLEVVDEPHTLFGKDPAFPNPPITVGLFGSLLFRLEWSTERAGLYDVETVRRPSQGSIVDRGSPWAVESGLRTVLSFEVADESLGGRFAFWRLVSDSLLALETGDDQGVFLRVRVGGGEDLPIQKREALGGWGSLRGLELKELSGEWSALGALEYRFSPISAFLDVGAVRQAGGDWVGPRAGVGVGLNLGDSGQLAFAWRTDDAAEATPEVRLLFGRAW